MVKNLPANAGGIRDTSSIPGAGRPLENEPTPVFLPNPYQVEEVNCMLPTSMETRRLMMLTNKLDAHCNIMYHAPV